MNILRQKIDKTTKKKKPKKKMTEMESKTAGQKEHALSLETLRLAVLMSPKCQANV